MLKRHYAGQALSILHAAGQRIGGYSTDRGVTSLITLTGHGKAGCSLVQPPILSQEK